MPMSDYYYIYTRLECPCQTTISNICQTGMPISKCPIHNILQPRMPVSKCTILYYKIVFSFSGNALIFMLGARW